MIDDIIPNLYPYPRERRTQAPGSIYKKNLNEEWEKEPITRQNHSEFWRQTVSLLGGRCSYGSDHDMLRNQTKPTRLSISDQIQANALLKQTRENAEKQKIAALKNSTISSEVAPLLDPRLK